MKFFSLIAMFALNLSCAQSPPRVVSSDTELTDSANSSLSALTADTVWADQQCEGSEAYNENREAFKSCVAKTRQQANEKQTTEDLKTLSGIAQHNSTMGSWREVHSVALHFEDGYVMIIDPVKMKPLSPTDLNQSTTLKYNEGSEYFAVLFGDSNQGMIRVLEIDTATGTLFMHGKEGQRSPIKKINKAEILDFNLAGIHALTPRGITQSGFSTFKEDWPKLQHRSNPKYLKMGKSPFL